MKKLLPIVVFLMVACGRNVPDAGRFEMPAFGALRATDITEGGVTLVAAVNNPEQIVEQGFKLWTADGVVVEVLATIEGDAFTATVSGLSEGSEYHFVAYAGNGSNMSIRSDESVFSTLKSQEQRPPDVPDTPDTPDNPDTPPDNPDTPDTPDNPDTPPDNPDTPPDNPDTPDTPDNPDTPPDNPDTPPDTPDVPDTPDTPDNPPDTPDYIEFPDSGFSAWMLWFFDEDKDGRLSKAEAEKVTTVEVSTMDISSLDGIEHLTGLTKLDATGKGKSSRGLLTSLDLSQNNRLCHVHLIYNNISSLTLGSQPQLYYLDVDYNELEEFDPRPYRQLRLLQLSYNKFRNLDFTGLDNLDELHCNDNPLESITLCNSILRYIDCSRTNITTLDLSRCPKINAVDCSGCTYLTTIYLAKGQIVGTIRKPENATIVYYE